MATNIGPKIGIEGEQEYRKQINSIINDTKVLKSQNDALTSSFDKEKKSVSQNAAEKKNLQAMVDTLTQKLQVQRDFLDKLSTATDENGNRTEDLVEATKKYQTIVNSTEAELNKYKKQLDDLPSSIELISQKLKDAGEKVKGFGDSMKDIGGKLTTSITAPIVALGTLGVNFNAQIEQYQVALTTLTGSAEEADRIISNLQEDASKSPFDTSSLIEANQYLISAGVDADEARKTINALGDAIAATGGGSAELSRMAQNLQQIKNTGKATSVDIKQFANAGINIYGLLADAMGKTTEEVKDMDVSYEVLAEALAKASEEGGKYYGAMENQSQTLTGQLSSLKDSVGQLLGDLTSELMPVIKDILSYVNEFIQHLKEMSPEQKKLILTIAGVAAAIGPVISAIGTVISIAGSLMTVVGATGVALSSFLVPIAAVVAGVAALIAIIMNWGDITEWIKNAVTVAKDRMVTDFNNLKTSLVASVTNIKEKITSTFNNLVSSALHWGRDLISNIISGITSKISSLVSAISDVAGKISSYLHFSEPDIGPLSDFHTWMPDFMGGLAKGINDNMYLVEDAMSNLADSMSMSGSSVNYGGVVINLNVPAGTDGAALVDEIENEIAQRTVRRKAVFG